MGMFYLNCGLGVEKDTVSVCGCLFHSSPLFFSCKLQLNETKLWANVKILLVLESSSRILTYVLVGALGVDPH